MIKPTSTTSNQQAIAYFVKIGQDVSGHRVSGIHKVPTMRKIKRQINQQFINAKARLDNR